jgi:hypothetical protein
MIHGVAGNKVPARAANDKSGECFARMNTTITMTNKKGLFMITQETLTPEIRELLSFSPLQYMLDFVVENPHHAHIYTDYKETPACCALLLGHYLWLAGQVEGNATAIAEMIRDAHLDVVIVFYDRPTAAQAMKAQFPRVYDNTRSVFNQTPTRQESGQPARITPITLGLLRSDVSNLEMIIGEVTDTATYDNLDVFCRKGFGFTFIADHEICAFCTSEYQSSASLAIGIEVKEGQQRKGIAREMGMAFLQEAAKRGLEVYWECWKTNEPSVKTALACGFHKVADYPVLIIDMSHPS